MAVLFSDDFNRADSATMGGNWADETGDLQVKNNQCYSSSTGSAFNSTSLGTASYELELTQTYDGSQSNWVMLLGRASGATKYNDCYRCYVQNETGSGDFVILGKRVSNSDTQLGSTYNFTATATTVYTYKLSMNGTAIKVYQDGVERISATDSAHTGEGTHGIRMGSGFYCDNYKIYDFQTSTLVNNIGKANIKTTPTKNNICKVNIITTYYSGATYDWKLSYLGGQNRGYQE